uniref:Reverse transcriptase zinc-binding domain-containing protein n=1 Tax=Cannabis sativa TaxID=3483 RepID=A0A803PQY2_CANSA
MHFRLSIMVWRVLIGAFPVREKLVFIPDKSCLLCNAKVESSFHLFWECPLEKALRFSGPFLVVPHDLSDLDLINIVLKLHEGLSQDESWKLFTFIGCLFTSIWETRNSLLFRNIKPDILQLRKMIMLRYQMFVSIRATVDNQAVSGTTIFHGREVIPSSANVFCVTDASWIGGVASLVVGKSDRNTAFREWFTKKCKVDSTMEAEILAILWTLKIYCDAGLPSIIIASDALLVVHALQSKHYPPCWKARPFVAEI